MKTHERIAKWVVIIIMTLAVLGVMFGCSPKISESTHTVNSDSLAVYDLREQLLEVKQQYVRTLTEKEKVERELASVSRGTGEKDSTLPVKTFYARNGDTYFKAQYQGFINIWELNVPERENRQTDNFDTVYVEKSESQALKDSSNVSDKQLTDNNTTTVVEPPSLNWWGKLKAWLKGSALGLCIGLVVGFLIKTFLF